jgi:hypothetical protein
VQDTEWHKVSNSFTKESGRDKWLKVRKWISILLLVPVLLLTVRSPGVQGYSAKCEVLAYTITKQKWPTQNKNIFKTICIPARPPVIVVNKTVSISFWYFYSLEIALKNIPLHTVKQSFVTLFVFGETIASFSTKICSSVTGTERNGTPFCFCPEVNSARLSGAEQPIRSRKKHYYLLSIY